MDDRGEWCPDRPPAFLALSKAITSVSPVRMKRQREPSLGNGDRPTSTSTSTSTSSSNPAGPPQKHHPDPHPDLSMACQHLTSAFASLAPPRPSQQVHREECTLCFDDQDGAEGIDVCLTCFNGGCTNNGEREHARLHYGKTGHALVVNVKRRRKSKVAVSSARYKVACAASQDR